MKRKIIQIADSTMLVSLPRSWVKNNNLHKGDELDLDIKNSSQIVISTQSVPTVERTTLDLTGKKDIIDNVLSAVYKSGYDEADVIYGSQQELEEIRNAIDHGLVGYEIVDQKTDRVLIRSISSLEAKEFETLMRRYFLFLISVTDKMLEEVNNGGKDLVTVVVNDNGMNKTSVYLRRILNKAVDVKCNRPHALYSLVDQLESIGEHLKRIADHCSQKKQPVTKDMVSILNDVNNMLSCLYYSCFLNFKVEGVHRLFEMSTRIRSRIENVAGKKDADQRLLRDLEIVAGSISSMGNALTVNFV